MNTETRIRIMIGDLIIQVAALESKVEELEEKLRAAIPDANKEEEPK